MLEGDVVVRSWTAVGSETEGGGGSLEKHGENECTMADRRGKTDFAGVGIRFHSPVFSLAVARASPWATWRALVGCC